MVTEIDDYNFGQSRFECIVIGFVLFAFGEIAKTIIGNYFPQIVFAIFGWYYIIKGFWVIKGPLALNELGSLYNVLLKFYLFLCIIMIIRGYMIEYKYQWISTAGFFNFHFVQKYYILPYLMPLVCFIPWQYYKFDKVVKYATWVAIISIVSFVLLFPSIVSSSIKSMSGNEVTRLETGVDFRFYTPFAFVSLLVAYITNKTWRINMLGLISIILINLIAARRGSSLISSILFVTALYYWSKCNEKSLGLSAKIIFVILIGGSIYFVLNSSLFEYIFERGMQDSRTGVDIALLNQMSPWELIFGKGLNGRYYYPLLVNDYLEGWRYGSETGFYFIVLRGGYLMAFTFILLLALPAFKGIFKSNNYLCKAGGFYILLSLLELYPFGWLEFSIKFLIIWMFVPLCISSQVRSMDNEQIREQFF